MKKSVLCLLITAIALSFSACGDNGDGGIQDSAGRSDLLSSDPPRSVSETEGAASAEGGATVGGTVYLTPNIVFSELRLCCSSKDGFYFMTDRLDSLYPRLKYVDYATRQEVFLCSDSSCNHDKESCTAVFSYEEFYANEGGKSRLFTYNNKLFFLSNPASDFLMWQSPNAGEEGGFSAGSFVEEKNAALCQMNLDGTGREKIFELPKGQTFETAVVGEGDNLWFIIKTPDIYKDEKSGAAMTCSKDRQLIKFSLSGKKIIESIPFDEYNKTTLELMGAWGNSLIFSGVEYPDSKTRLDYAELLAPKETLEEEIAHMDETNDFFDRCFQVFFTMDTNAGKIKEIYRQKGFFCNIHQYNGNLYVDSRDYGITRVDISTGEAEKFTPPEEYELWGFLGDKIVYMHKTPDYSDNSYYFCDLGSEELKKAEPIVNLSTDLLAVSGSTALITTDGAFGDIKDMALISLEDIYNGNRNFEYIKGE